MYLQKIVDYKRACPDFLLNRDKEWDRLLEEFTPRQPRGFASSLTKQSEGPNIIAEFKRASPSKGAFKFANSIAQQVVAYEEGGAKALSILTEPHFFQACPEDLAIAQKTASLPILRKDFLLEKWEISQSKLLGADAVLLIAAVLDDKNLSAMVKEADRLGIEVLLEIHCAEELKRALALPLAPQAIGINNRNLVTFELNLETTATLASRLPKEICRISESGFATRQDLMQFNSVVNAFLIGEALMKSPNPKQVLSDWTRG